LGQRTIIPFGPQHPVLPEPIHLDLVLEDEKVIEAIPSIGFIHRGLEKLVEKKDFQEYVFVAERICGICSFIHGMGYSQTIETVMGLEIPDRAKYMRTIWSELSRIHSHLLWLGLLADAFGFENLFMQCWRIREQILDVFEETTGGRVIFSVCKVGGIRRDVDAEKLDMILKVVKDVETSYLEMYKVFKNDFTVAKRLKGVGVISKEEAHDLGCVGPVARGSGVAVDLRQLGYAAYGELDFEPIIATEGDSYARTFVRMQEILQSIQLIRQAIGKIPEGEIDVKVKGFPQGEYISRLEQPRGEVIYHAKANGTKFLERLRVRTPTFANIPFLVKSLQGVDLADVALMVLTIDPCISCAER
jgi:ech hydrogenase subunit E